MNKAFKTDWSGQAKGYANKIWLSAMGALLVMLLLSSCASGSPSSIVSVTVSPNPATAQVKGNRSFTAVAKDAAGNTIATNFVWSSSDPSIASINASSGVATGIAKGSTNISATAGGVSGSATLNVVNIDGASIWDTSVWDSGATWGQ